MKRKESKLPDIKKIPNVNLPEAMRALEVSNIRGIEIIKNFFNVIFGYYRAYFWQQDSELYDASYEEIPEEQKGDIVTIELGMTVDSYIKNVLVPSYEFERDELIELIDELNEDYEKEENQSLRNDIMKYIGEIDHALKELKEDYDMEMNRLKKIKMKNPMAVVTYIPEDLDIEEVGFETSPYTYIEIKKTKK